MATILNYYYQILGNVDYYAILAFIFLAMVSTTAGIAYFCLRGEAITPRLSKLLGPQKYPSRDKPKLIQEESTGLIAKVAKPLHNIVAPDEKAVQKKLRLKLMQGGFRSRQAYRNYLASKVLCALLLPVSFFFLSVYYSMSIQIGIICLIIASSGFFLPNVVLLQITQKRQQRILKAVPDALDMMVVCVEAGLGLDMTIKRVGDEVRPLCKDLSDEFYLTNLEVQAGRSREESMRNMALRTGVNELKNLITLLIQTNKLGTSLAKTLRVHAEAMRTKRRQVAEEIAAKSAVKLLFPLIFFIFPAMFVVLIGPAGIRIAKTLLPGLSGGP